MPTLELSSVSVCRPLSYGGFREVLIDVSLALSDGSLSILTGMNGSGKSTLLAAMAGLLACRGGRVSIGGLDISRLKRRSMLPLVGILFQNPEKQIFAATVYDEIAFAGRNAGFPPLRLTRAVRDAAVAVGLHMDLMDRSPYSLSEGQRRRVAIASVIMVAPRVLLLDEPTAGLDYSGKSAITSLVRTVMATGGCVVIATHEPADFIDEAQRVFVLESGVVREEALESAQRRFTPWVRLYQALLERGVALPSGLADESEFVAALRERLQR